MGQAQAMRIALITLSVLACSACGSPNLGDAGVDAPPIGAQTFDVDQTPDGGTPPVCPGELFGRASQNQATCTHAPEICRSGIGTPTAIECLCNVGTWECHEYRP